MMIATLPPRPRDRGEDRAEGASYAVDADAGARHEGAPGVASREVPDRWTDVSDQLGATEPDYVNDEDRYQYQVRYRATVNAVYLADAHERWEEVKSGFAEERREHPVLPRASPDIDEETFGHVERGCKEIYESEENIVTPVIARIETADPERKLVGLEFRCKGQDRILEKVGRQMEAQPDLSADDALASVKDAIRYTFQYTEDHYTRGMDADVDRLKGAGFELVELRNSWGREEHKGINSRWRIPENGQLFEVQFHTQISFEAKQLTHPAYERLRTQTTSKAERDQLEAFQRRVNAFVPVPPGALIYRTTHRRARANEDHLLCDRQRIQQP